MFSQEGASEKRLHLDNALERGDLVGRAGILLSGAKSVSLKLVLLSRRLVTVAISGAVAHV